MEQIKLEHLSAYLPYELKVKFSFDDEHTHSFVGIDISQNGIHLISPFGDFGRGDIRDIKPILRPLSGMTEDQQIGLLEVELHKEMSYAIREWIEYFESDTANIYTAIIRAPYPVINWALSQHFDIFNLIPRGLAIAKKI